jgi:predicted TPR repeat methyltransferase
VAILFHSSGDLIADRRYAIGRDFAVRAEHRAAADMFMQAVEAAPGFVSAWFALGEMLEKLGDTAAAIVAFRKAKELDARDPHGAGVHLMRLKAEHVRDMPRDYVRTLFDQYAARFDEALVGKLAYRGPELLLDAVTRACTQAKRPMHFAAALDLGCGTGLGGAAFRKHCDRLTGMDLSPQMVEQARGKQIYDRLEVGDIPRFLMAERHTAHYDLVLAADVFTYLADLHEVVAGCAHVMDPGGLLAFTVETHPGPEMIVGDKLRYAHGMAHVQDTLRHAALKPLVLENASTRNDGGVAVPGLVVVVTK